MKNSLYMIMLVILGVSSCIDTDIVEEVVVPETVSITASVDSLMLGDSFTFAADFFDILGRRAEGTVNWSSSDATIIDINQEGVAMALTPGNVYISAAVGVARDSVRVNSGEVTSIMQIERMGMFRGLRNYSVEGTFTLIDTDDELELTFGSDFRSSNGPGLFIYLSNSGTSVNGGIELGPIKANSGMQTYTISKEDAQLNSYSHVVVYCKPFGVSFGFGEFDN